jgi:hypothetical protein
VRHRRQAERPRKERLPDGAAQDDWRQATGTGAAQAAVPDYRPGWCPADALLLIRRVRAAC